MMISHSFLYVYQRVSHGHPMVTLPKTWDVDGSSMVTPLWRWHDRNDMTDCFCLCLYIYIYIYPIGSMYAIYGNIYHQYTPNVSIYTIHGSYEYIIIYCCMCMYTYIYIYIHTLCTYIRDFYAPKTARSHWPIGPAMNTPGSFASHSPDSANRWPRFKQQAATQFLGDST